MVSWERRARPDCPRLSTSVHCGTPSPMRPEADQPHFFFEQLAFLTKPSLYRTAPFDNSFGVPSSLFLFV
ncbi:hypothetical protein ACRRTK_005261 [Alexandromys fortis]